MPLDTQEIAPRLWLLYRVADFHFSWAHFCISHLEPQLAGCCAMHSKLLSQLCSYLGDFGQINSLFGGVTSFTVKWGSLANPECMQLQKNLIVGSQEGAGWWWKIR